MARPQAYDPQEGYKYQILTRNPAYGRTYDHCDYAKDKEEKNHLLGEYRMAYGAGWEFKVITLPVKYWPLVFQSEEVQCTLDGVTNTLRGQDNDSATCSIRNQGQAVPNCEEGD